ncbi:MAG: type IX secretion system protein PorQ [Saprospiraceae bacterium]|nr:type IX secretion system protein PorQ [Candidatus Brachybacter algidus]
MRRIYLLLYIFICTNTLHLNAQIETDKVFPFLNQSNSARMSALGGFTMAEISMDVSQTFANPALFKADESFPISFTHQFLLGKTGIGNLIIGKQLKWKDVSIHGGIQYADYGTIDGYDDQGVSLGPQSAAEYNFLIGASTQLYENLRLGSNLKFINSNLADYNSSALGLDLALAYHIPEGTGTFGFVVKNLGTQLNNYASVREVMPVEVQASGSVRLKHLPLRIGLLAHHLQRWNLLYDNPYDVEQSFSFDDQFAKPEIKQYGFVDNFFRHMVLQAEMSMGKKEGFKIRMSYNHFKKRQLSVNGFRSLSGFSGGLGLRISKFNFDYGISVYHIAGSAHTLTLTTDLSSFRKQNL